MRYLSLVIVLVFGSLMACTRNDRANNILVLDQNWKFRAGDDLAWANPDYDDSGWDTIRISNYWDYKGYESYDGIAWYRVTTKIPSSLLKKSYLEDSLQIILGNIDDRDQLYINGVFIGQNNEISDVAPHDSTFFKDIFYNRERRYVIGSDHPSIFWDKKNVIAVRVYDQWGGGGMFAGIPTISTVDLFDKLVVNNDQASHPYQFDQTNVRKSFELKNSSDVDLKGRLIIEATKEKGGRPLFRSKHKVNLEPGEMEEFPVELAAIEEVRTIKLTFKHRDSRSVIEYFDEVPYVLTPPAPESPRINGAKVVGVRPGNPFLFMIPATGARPMVFDVKDLPNGLTMDRKSGIVTGSILERGEYDVMIVTRNDLGEDRRALKIVVGDTIALTPPLGWNSWNCWGLAVDEDKVIQSAHDFINKGLINHGWTYINIDDGWQARRDEQGQIIPNSKFGNMKALADSLHRLGLKFGIYSSPGPRTCGGYTGSYQHEIQDANTYAGWGVDYLKYDWCTYGILIDDPSLADMKKPYLVMQKAMSQVKRDIVFSLCQYGMGKVWEWGAEVGGNLWRTTGDISDSWEILCYIGFNQVEQAPFAGPGHWNDPDMMIVGWVGWGPDLHLTNLTTDEQYTHVSLWSLLSAPLLIGCDLSRLDDFTLNLLTNDEVLAVNQDPLGKQAIPLVKEDNIQVWVKELENGSKAAGIFNLDPGPRKVLLDLADIGISGKQLIRDIWRQKEIGVFENEFALTVPAHGVVLIKLSGSDSELMKL